MPPEGVWVPLICALTWIRYDHAVDIDELLTETQARLGVSEDELRAELQDTWQALADQGTTGRVRIRGRPEGEREERELGHDDLRNCRWLAWKPKPRSAEMVLNPSDGDCGSGPYDVGVRRYEDTFEGEFEGLSVSAINYAEPVVSRPELMDFHPQPMVSVRKLKSSVAGFDKALQWLEHQLRTLPRKSHRRAFFLKQMQTEFGISSNKALEVWSQARRKFPDWTGPGYPPKNHSK